ncbi:MAG: hypothetical protein RL203_1010 [Pseudomonadota bacterium]|jgi:uncharacterized protein (TIGR00369 family)
MHSELENWLSAEATLIKSLKAGAGPGVATREQIAGKTGLEAMQAMLRGEIPFPPIGQTLSFYLMHVEDGHAIFQGSPKAEHLNPLGTIHGGFHATILDSALGCAVHSKLPIGRAYTTTQLNVNIVRALSPKIDRVRAIGHVVHFGRQLATAEAKLVGPDGTLYAHATCTCLVFDQK